mmetsp:Transcript_62331/g.146446  ORF Transcript_62331/g.146446 Transcript_62331/m.146446 type:complete len:84 (+) Transcript_62331:418-669(+)|eukprot:1263406-Rhodomonas_salina.1
MGARRSEGPGERGEEQNEEEEGEPHQWVRWGGAGKADRRDKERSLRREKMPIDSFANQATKGHGFKFVVAGERLEKSACALIH